MPLSIITPENVMRSIYSFPLNVHRNDSGLVLDMSYITQRLIVCSYPVTKYPKLLYRNSLKDLILFLNKYHGMGNWKIYNFKVEVGDADYSTEELISLIQDANNDLSNDENQISNSNKLPQELDKKRQATGKFGSKSKLPKPMRPNFNSFEGILCRKGWIDHFPPPFLLLEDILNDIHMHLTSNNSKVAVLHCKMGKGRSGTVVVAYLMKYMQCPLKESCELFTNNRFKAGITNGVTILSQLRYLRYHEMFLYLDSPLERPYILKEILESRFKLKVIELINPLSSLGSVNIVPGFCSLSMKVQIYNSKRDSLIDIFEINFKDDETSSKGKIKNKLTIEPEVILDRSDICLSFGICANSTEFINNITRLSCSAHFWLNLYWETLVCSKNDSIHNYTLQNLRQDQARCRDGPNLALFNIKWEELDGMCGTKNKGFKLFDSVSLKWQIL